MKKNNYKMNITVSRGLTNDKYLDLTVKKDADGNESIAQWNIEAGDHIDFYFTRETRKKCRLEPVLFGSKDNGFLRLNFVKVKK